MNKRKKGISYLCILFIMLLTTPVYGKTNEVIVEEDAMSWSELEFATESNATQSSLNPKTLRGMYIGFALVQLSDEYKGVLGILAQTDCYTYVDQIDMTIYLDIMETSGYDEDDWHTLDYYTYSWTKDDAQDGELYAVSVSFELHGLERGRYYRLRGSHYIYSGNNFEARTSQSSWILLE